MSTSKNDPESNRPTIRCEQLADGPIIHEVNASAFPTASEANLVDALRAAGFLRLSLVAECGGQIVGHIAFSPVTLDGAPNNSGGVGLAPLAVRPERQRQGIGSALVRAGLTACANEQIGFVVVLGEPDYYTRFGFRPASQWGMTNLYTTGPEFMALELRTAAIPPAPGMLRYAPQFNNLT